jgi:hypothetical protein
MLANAIPNEWNSFNTKFKGWVTDSFINGIKNQFTSGFEIHSPSRWAYEILGINFAMDPSSGFGGFGIAITGNLFIIREDADIQRIARKLLEMQKFEQRKRGLAIV